MKKRLIFIAVAFSISLMMMAALSMFSVERLNTYIRYSDSMDHSGFVIERIYDLEKAIRDIDRTERGYMLTEDTLYLRGMKKALDTIPVDIAALRELCVDNIEMIKDIDSFSYSYSGRVKALKENIAYVDTSRSTNLSQRYYDSRALMITCSKLLRTMHEAEISLKQQRFLEEQRYEKLTRNSIVWLLFVFCVVTLFLFTLLIKELRGRMQYQEELQAKVQDLKRSHSELQEIAYVASHDLQEPLRKIQIFSDLLIYKRIEEEDSELNNNLHRIHKSAGRMQSLIGDLLSLTSLTKIDENKKEVNLNQMMHYILLDLEFKIESKNALITTSKLPVISGYENQLKILFTALIDNSLKFCKGDVRCEIKITYSITNGRELLELNSKLKNKKFYKIVISDNGIGFDKQFIFKMFQVFQRLHHDESGYEGKGIGLAICQRIITNHDGYILADGGPGTGAEFMLYFPV